jgi:ribosomal protein L37AE/L43A
MKQLRKTIDGTDITVVYDRDDEPIDVSDCPGCGRGGINVRDPSRSGTFWRCSVCGYEFVLN